MNIAAIAFLDTSAFTATFVTKYRAKSPDIWMLRGGGKDEPVLKEWRTARALLTRIENAAAPFNNGERAKIMAAWLYTLKPGAFEDWRVSADEGANEFRRLRLCLLPSPGAWSYSGGEGTIIPVGQLTYVNHLVMHSEINAGPCARTHLVCDVHRPDVP